MPIQEIQKMFRVDATETNAEILGMLCLATCSLVDIFFWIFTPKSLKQLCKKCTIYQTTFHFVNQP